MCRHIYRIVMKVPLGERPGEIHWKEEGGSVSGFLNIMGFKNAFRGSLLPDGIFEIEGSIKTLMRNIPFTAKGRIEGRFLTMALSEPRHTYTLKGVEITENEKIL